MKQTRDVIVLGGIEIRYLVEGADKGGLGVFEMTIAPGASVPPPHSHAKTEECVYVLDGTLQYTVGAETRNLVAGDYMETPSGSVHSFCNTSTSPARALIIMTPDIGPDYFHEVVAVFAAGGPPDRAKLATVMAKHGVVPAPPAP
jgi:quercetin dioxygenase-like cupin family protein